MDIANSLPGMDVLQRVGRQIAAHALEHDRDKTLDRSSWDELTKANLWRIPVASEYGGLGLTWDACVKCIDEIAKHCEDVGFLITVLGHVGSIKLLNDYGTPEQKDLWIPRLLQGEIAVTAMIESTGGSDFSKMRLVVGTPGEGLSILYQIISFERALYGIIAAGLINGIIEKGMQRVTEQQAFGKPLAEFQYIQRRLTDMKMGAIICRNLAYESLKLLDAQDSQASIVCSVTKFQAGELLFKAAEDIVQIYGHHGFMSNAISKYLRDAAGMRIAGGTSDLQRVNIFNQMRRQASM